MTGNLDWEEARRGGGSWYHMRVKSISRAAGQSAVAAAAYRLGERLVDQATGQVQDYTRRSGVMVTFSIAPEDAPDWATDPEPLWNGVEASETRKNSKLAREYELALPASLDAETREAIARAFAQELVDRYGVAVSTAIHAPSGKESELNYHAHILSTTRAVGEGGFGAKTRVLDDQQTGPEEIKYLREYAATLINDALEAAGMDERVDHRSFADRGIDRLPTVHMGVAASAMERRGVPSIRGAVNQDVHDRNAHIASLLIQLDALNRQIAEEQEQALDARFGEPEPEQMQVEEGRGPVEPAPPEAAASEPPLTDAERAAAWEARKIEATNSIRDSEPFVAKIRATGYLPTITPSTGWVDRFTDWAIYVQEKAVQIFQTSWQKVVTLWRGPEPDDPEIER